MLRLCLRIARLNLASAVKQNVSKTKPLSNSKRFVSSTPCCCQEHLSSIHSPEFTQTDGPAVLHRRLPVMTSRPLAFVPPNKSSKQAWLESLEAVEHEKLGLLDLHPDIFAAFPRVDILWWNIYWQRMYCHINYEFVKNRAEMRGGGRKPWPQKGTGRARHGSIRSPLWNKGGKTFGPRGPTTYFFMLSTSMRSLGLRVALSCKYAQNNLHIVENLDMPSDDPKYLRQLIEARGWGLSALFVDDTDVMPRNITIATEGNKSYNLMPVYGLNVYSMLKHETLILTLAAVEKIEEKLLYQMHKQDRKDKPFDRKLAHLQVQPHIPK